MLGTPQPHWVFGQMMVPTSVPRHSGTDELPFMLQLATGYGSLPIGYPLILTTLSLDTLLIDIIGYIPNQKRLTKIAMRLKMITVRKITRQQQTRKREKLR